jgi:DNA (cytosine-5)-methyltransferase 1
MRDFIELFSGIGLVRMAVERVGFRCVLAVDNDPAKVRIYRSHFSEDECLLGDAFDVDAIVSRVKSLPSLVTASFPCTDVSLAGPKGGLGGRSSSAFFAIPGLCRALAEKFGEACPIVLIENVTGLYQLHGGEHLRMMTSSMLREGYLLCPMVVDASHFLPQSRRRVYVACVRASHGLDGAEMETEMALSGHAAYLACLRSAVSRIMEPVWIPGCLEPFASRLVSVADVLDDSEGIWWPDEKVQEEIAKMEPLSRSRLSGPEGSVRYGFGYRRTRKGVCRIEARFDGLAGCLRTSRGGSSTQIVIRCGPGQGEVRMRPMSVREMARLQGAESFRIQVGAGISKSSYRYGFGDAVCVPAAEWACRQAVRLAQEAKAWTTSRQRPSSPSGSIPALVLPEP